MGYYNEDGNPDYELAMQMKAEADLYIEQNLPDFKKTNVAKTKFKKEEDYETPECKNSNGFHAITIAFMD